jgi:hypothetical protein
VPAGGDADTVGSESPNALTGKYDVKVLVTSNMIRRIEKIFLLPVYPITYHTHPRINCFGEMFIKIVPKNGSNLCTES